MDNNGSYVWRMIRTVTVAKLLEQFGLSEVDYLFMDIEGVEYSLLPRLFLHANQTGGTFCQVILLVLAEIGKSQKWPIFAENVAN